MCCSSLPLSVNAPLPLSLSLPRAEVSKIMQQTMIRASLIAYSFMISAPVIIMLIFVPSVLLTGSQESLSAYVFVLSLTHSLRLSAIVIMLRSLVNVFDTRTSLKRLQVLPSLPPSLSPPV